MRHEALPRRALFQLSVLRGSARCGVARCRSRVARRCNTQRLAAGAVMTRKSSQ
jgi:hypothetical protein